MTITDRRRFSADPYAALVILAWFALYVWRALVGHAALGTNAFDLSVFDYAIWNLTEGGRGYVPFMGYSIFSHHFMPILAVVTPFYSAFPTPAFLLVLQVTATAGAAAMFFKWQRQIGVERIAALALMTVFLLSRRTHGATVASFYPECFQAVLMFAVAATWGRGRWTYRTSALLLLMTKEDAALYLATFALASLFSPLRNVRRSALTVTAAVVWFAFAMFVSIPQNRAVDGLSVTNPLIESRYGSPGGEVDPRMLAGRVLSTASAGNIVNLVATTGGLSLFGAAWLVPALPGILINLAADPTSLQAALTGHYVWPVLPWLFMAAAAGVVWLSGRSRRLSLAWVGLLLVGTAIDNPALQRIAGTRVSSEAETVRAELTSLRGTVILAQANLIPHLPHQPYMFAVSGGDARPTRTPDLVLFTEVGDLWPLTREEVLAEIRRYDNDPAYQRVKSGPLHAFVLRPTP